MKQKNGCCNRQTSSRSPESGSGSVAETPQEDTGGEDTQEASMEATLEASVESKRTVVVYNEEDELELVEFLNDSELLYNKKLMDYKDPNKREAVWHKFWANNNMGKAACKRWFQS